MLIDVCYDSRVQLVWSGEVEPQYLFTDLFLQGVSALKVLVESDDLSPVDAKEEARLSAAGKEKNVTHIYHHLPSPTADKVQFPPPRNETADAFVVMKGETAAFKDLEFAVQRATSRLIEMSGQDYMNSNRK